MPSIKEIMTTETCTVDPSTPIVEAAKIMRDTDVGDVIVVDDDSLVGIVTDRDIVVRAIAEGRDPAEITAGEICSGELVTASPDDDIREVADRMSEHAVRRIPVVEGGRPVGVVSLGDLALEGQDDPLADISAAPSNS